MTELECKVLVLGGGPGGYVAAIRAGQLGLDTILVEADNLGGTCLNVGCIPSKAYIHVAEQFMQAREHQLAPQVGIHVKDPEINLSETKAWKDGIVNRLTSGVGGLLKKAKVNVVKGWGYMENGKTCTVKTETGGVTIRAEHVILATGSTPVELPFMKFNGRVINSTQALALTEVPKKLVVVGAGYIGLELGITFAKMGSQVTIAEGERRILPTFDAELTGPVKKRLGKLHIEVLTQTKAKGLSKNGKGIRVQTEGQPETELKADKILVAVGRRPAVTGWGLDELMLDRDGSFIAIDDQCRTSMREVYAIGDVTGDPMLAHRAMAQGEMVAEIIAGENRSWDKVSIPAVCFTDPEVVTAGLTPDEAKAQGYAVKTGIFPFAANGRAMTLQSDGGFVRIVAREDNHLVLGIQAVGAHVSELSASFSLALEMGARLEDIAATIHAHPTQSEAFQEAALLTLGHALHI